MKKNRQSAGAATAPQTIDEYLSALPPEARAHLEKLRAVIRAAAPMAVEDISYRMPAYRYKGILVYFAAFRDHYSLFPASVSLMRAHAAELKPYVASKGTIHFQFDKPLPVNLVKRLVRERIAENGRKELARKRG